MAPAYDFDIDKYLNPFVLRNRVHLLPKPIAHFLGYRSTPPKPLGSVLLWFWSFIGAVCGILVVEAVFTTHLLRQDGAPIIVGSLGASAILLYNTIDSPLSQPRNIILGQLFSSLVGVSIAKLFLLSPSFESIRFVGGALAVGLASLVMGMTKTVHPPAGATALLAVTSDEIMELGWFLAPLIVLGSVLMTGVACVVNNLQRRWPLYWWTPVDLSRKEVPVPARDVENQVKDELDDTENIRTEQIMIDGKHVSIPDWISLDDEEKAMLEILRSKLEIGMRTISPSGSVGTIVAEPPANRGS